MGEAYWGGLVEWLRERVAGEGKIDTADLALFQVTDSPREAVATIRMARDRRGRESDGFAREGV
jgi:predicted Rossmann-fold nucleotide-binding protein